MCCGGNEKYTGGLIYGLHTGDHKFRYIGQTVQSPTRRLCGHKSDAKHSKRAVAQWVAKHADDVQICVIECFSEMDQTNIDLREQYFINKYQTYIRLNLGGLNHTLGGRGGLGNVDTPEQHSKRISNGKPGVPRPIHRGNQYAKGYRHSEETRKRMSELKKGHIPWNKGVTGYTVGPISEVGKKNRSIGQLNSPLKGISAHLRWHTRRNIVKPECNFCAEAKTEEKQ